MVLKWLGYLFLAMPLMAVTPEDQPIDMLCGVKCLYVGLLTLDVDVGSFSDFVDECGTSDARGYSLGQIEEIAKKHGLQTLAVNTTLDNLQAREGQFVCLAYVDGKYFVNIGDVSANEVWFVDPPGDGVVARSLFEKRWDGAALLISKEALQPESSLSRRWRWLGWSVVIIGVVASVWGWSRRSKCT